MNIKKPISTIELALSVITFVKSASLVLVLTMLEWARQKQKMAEDKQAVAETDLKVMEGKNEIDEKHANNTADAIIDEYLKGK